MRFSRSLRAFTLLEILIAVVIIAIVLAGSITMTDRYVASVRWERLFDRLERQLLDTNVYALGGFSAAAALPTEDEAKVQRLPEQYHVYLESGDPMLWYFETQRLPGAASDLERMITYQAVQDFDVEPLRLKEIVLREGEQGERQTRNAVVITWSHPFSQISFHLLDRPLNKVGDQLISELRLPEQRLGCQEFPKLCSLTLLYEHPGTATEKSLVLDLQKGMEREF